MLLMAREWKAFIASLEAPTKFSSGGELRGNFKGWKLRSALHCPTTSGRCWSRQTASSPSPDEHRVDDSREPVPHFSSASAALALGFPRTSGFNESARARL